MTIKEFAEQKKVSKQAVYKSINRNGISAKQLTDRRGNLTKHGLTVLRNLFPDDRNQVDRAIPVDPVPDAVPDPGNPNPFEQEIDRLRQQVDELKSECDDWKQKYFQLVDSSQEESQQLRILIQNEQKLRLQAEQKGFFRRLFAGRKENNDSV